MKITTDFTGKALKTASWNAKTTWENEGEVTVSSKTILAGLGKKEKFTLQKMRKAVTRVLSQAKTLKAKEIALDLTHWDGGSSAEELAGAAVEGARLALYRFDKYKSKPSPAGAPSHLILVFKKGPHAPGVQKAVRSAETVMSAVGFARDLANEPANVMTPPQVARAAKTMASQSGLSCRVYSRNEIQKMKMGGILAVSRGSSFAPQLVVLEYKRGPKRFAPIVLVGKGITFDTGGISLKPSADMDKMKFDMCGAAAVIGAIKAVADLKLPAHVVGIVPVCENMPGSTAQRPGDIIRCHNGKTVEVLNTDAEGRLILADALSFAKGFRPRILVDVATLTGACAATFGEHAIGLMGTDAELLERVQSAGERAGERCWQLPLWEEYFDLIRATNADIQNISKKNAGTITAGMFLKEFSGHTRSWAHLDIAGTAWTNAGATGVGVRLFVELIQSFL